MRVNTGRGWVDMGPGSSGGLTGHHSAHQIGLEATTRHTAQGTGAICPICTEPTIGGRYYCSPAHAKLGYGQGR